MKNLKIKKIKILKFIFSFFFIFLFSFNGFSKKVFAETFHKYDIDVVVKKDGSARFTSIIDLTSTKGTEYYIPIENLGLSEIKNFKVYEITQDNKTIEYEFVENWNIKWSIEQKKNKNGIIKTSKGYELAFGIGDYSRKQFVLEYDVINFAKLLNDSDMLFWRFVNDRMSSAPKEVKVKISLEDMFLNNTNSKIWGFGTTGEVVFQNGSIVFRTFEPMRSSNYVTILSQINKGYFLNGEEISKNFESYKNIAFKGSAYKEQSLFEKIIDFIKRYFYLILGLVLIIIGKILRRKKYSGGYKKGNLKGQYYRDIPEKNWWKLALILESSKFEGTNAIIRAIFLKWIQEKRLEPITEETGTFFKKEINSLKILENSKTFENTFEKELFKMLVESAGEDKILQKNEFSKYVSKDSNYDTFKSITDEIEEISEMYISNKKFAEKKIFRKKFNENGREFTANLVKYYNYLKDFTLLDERELEEIKVWKELLIYATLFDVSKVVEKRLEKLSPEVLEKVETNMGYNYNSMRYMSIYSNIFSSNVIEAYNRNVIKGTIGSGGFTSIGGGDGSFGGGSGGGSR